jgi:hypothetical protein
MWGHMKLAYRLAIILAFTFLAGAIPSLLNGATSDAVLVGAGDIAACGVTGPAGSKAELTAQLLDGIAGVVFTAGDNVYNNGTTTEFQSCYDPTWGRHKARTRPSPGNHDYIQPNAAPYFAYFGASAGPAGLGYYSYDLGAWHVVSLNSNIAADTASPQAQWLRADLAAHPATCVLAYWHHPLFSSGSNGNIQRMDAIWRILYSFGADVVISGHDHDFERFAPQTADAEPDLSRGIREFVVGTGGGSLHAFRSVVQPNSEVRNADTFGVLKLTLHSTSYDWQFIPIAGQTFRDSGSATCVAAVPDVRFWRFLPMIRQ